MTTSHPLLAIFSARHWKAVAYLATYLPMGALMFAATVTVTAVSGALSIVWIGLPLLAAAPVLIRGMAELERGRARLAGATLGHHYRKVTEPGLFAQIKVRWSDPATMRNLAYLVPLFPLLLILDVIVLAFVIAFWAMVSLPLWYWSIPFTASGGETVHGIFIGSPAFGIWIGDLPSALIAAAVGLIASVLFAPVTTAAARLHARVARSLVGPYVDPLGEAKRILAEPGPLSVAAGR